MTDILVKQAEIPTPIVGRPSIKTLSLFPIVGHSSDAAHDLQKLVLPHTKRWSIAHRLTSQHRRCTDMSPQCPASNLPRLRLTNTDTFPRFPLPVTVPRVSFPNGESGADVYDRITIFEDHMIRDINAGRFASTNTALVLVTHGLALRVFLMRWWVVRDGRGANRRAAKLTGRSGNQGVRAKSLHRVAAPVLVLLVQRGVQGEWGKENGCGGSGMRACWLIPDAASRLRSFMGCCDPSQVMGMDCDELVMLRSADLPWPTPFT